MSSNDLRLLNVSKDFASSSERGKNLHVLDHINLDIKAGEFISIVGASGCGKSTLLRLIVGLDDQYQGKILLDGRAVREPGLDRGIIFQDHRLFPWLTVEQNIALGLKNSPLSAAQKSRTVDEHIKLVGLQSFAKSFPRQISGGMAQRVAIARALVNRPDVLLLDEPLGALDALTRARLQDELLHIWSHEKITMVLVTHDVDEAVYLGDRVVIMSPNPGRIKKSVDVTLPRPRNRSDPAFVELRDNILAELTVGREPVRRAVGVS